MSETRRQQATTAEVLKAINRSTFDLQEMLGSLAEFAAKLCNCSHAAIYVRDGDWLRGGAFFGAQPEEEQASLSSPLPIDRKSISGRVMLSGQPEFIADIEADTEYDYAPVQQWSNARALMAVPLIREGQVEGVFSVARPEPGTFSKDHSELLQTFADQAVIAIENTRLVDEVQARNRQLTEALGHQTATGAILRAIAASPTDIQPVLNAVAESAAKLCEAYDAVILLQDGDFLAFRAHYGPIPVDVFNLPIERDWVTGRAFLDCRPIQVEDLQAAEEFPAGRDLARRQGHRTTLAVPLLRKNEAIGVLTVRRLEVQPFSQKQIDLLATFADQAVIAIENVRLFEEAQTQNRRLSESLERQTATSAILRAIASSPTDIQPVLDVVAESAARLCEAFDSVIFLSDGSTLSIGAHYGPIPLNSGQWKIGRESVGGRAILDRKPVHVHDILEAGDEFPVSREWAIAEGQRSLLAVPLLRDEKAIGSLIIRRPDVQPFSQRHIDLLATFADQAVIAIENTRLFEESQQRNRELSATSEVLRVIAQSPTDVQPVFDIIAECAAKLCNSEHAHVDQFDGSDVHFVAQYGLTPDDEIATRRVFPRVPDRGTAGARAILTGRVEHIPDFNWIPIMFSKMKQKLRKSIAR